MTSTEIVRERIKSLVDRGVFNGCEETFDRSGKLCIRFRWLLGREFLLEYDPEKQRLTAKDIFPTIKHRSFIDNDLRKFIASSNYPDHRRIDREKSALTYTNKKQQISLVMTIYDDHLSYGVGALLNIINELFKQIGLYHTGYLHQQLGVPEE